MITYRPARTDADLLAILELQSRNLPEAITDAELQSQGFLTVRHDLDTLRAMNEPHGHTQAWDGPQLAGYALAMDPGMRARTPILRPFFERLDALDYQGRPLAETPYALMGQVAVAKPYRGRGVFAGLYRDLEARLAAAYRLLITEISTRNPRSLRAHEKIGYPEWVRFTAPDGEVWVIVKKEL